VNDAKDRIYFPLLILRCQTGDEAALRELIERYSPGLRLFLCKITGQESLADDLLQESWFDVYRKINSLRSPDSFVAWLYRIARDKAYRHLRRRSLPSESDDGNLAETIAADESGFSFDEAAEVRAALDDLPLEQREVLLLRFVQDISYEQIAQVIGRPVGTVRSRIHYAKLALRAKLESNTVRKEMPS
jgi:RNA polymerase sigma-70 factor (ECF subfamily)